MIALRPYQSIAVDSIRAEFRAGRKRVLLVAPTGSGKTTIFSFMAKGAVERGQQTIVMAHRVELVDQISETLTDFGVEHSFIAAGYPYDRRAPLHIASVQTLIRKTDKVAAPQFIICDEAHHCLPTNTYGKILSTFHAARVVGTSATPRRASGEGLGAVFDSMVEGPAVSQLIHAGYLSDFKIYGPPTVNADGLHVRAGEFIQSEVAALIDKPSVMGDAIAHYRKLADGKPAVAFCYSVEHSQATAAAFREAGYKFEHVDGRFGREARLTVVGDFKAGRITGLCSCDLVSEGFDVPRIHCGILLRPTASESLYLQQIGRCLRTDTGKDRATIIDHVGNASRHGLPDEDRDWSLEGREKRAGKAKAAASVRICPQCFAAQRPRANCYACGFEFPVEAREVAHVEGTLVEIQRRQARREQGSAQTLESLIEIGKQRGYRNPQFWARKVYEGRKRA